MKNIRDYKVCPRCDTKCSNNMSRCPECGLVFSRLENASNKLAKKMILKGDKADVIYTKTMPSDVSKLKALLLCGFLGIFGAHNFYLGRFPKAIFMCICGVLAVACVMVTNYTEFYDKFVSFFFLPCAIMAIFVVFDFINICFEKYKIPIALKIDKKEEKK